MSAVAHPTRISSADLSFYEKLNTVWHKRALNLFMLIVLGHWAEHLVQAYQIYVLGWPRPQAGGVLGFSGQWTYSFAPENGGTRVTIREDGEVSNVIFRFMSRYVFGQTATIDSYLTSLAKHFGENDTPK